MKERYYFLVAIFMAGETLLFYAISFLIQEEIIKIDGLNFRRYFNKVLSINIILRCATFGFLICAWLQVFKSPADLVLKIFFSWSNVLIFLFHFTIFLGSFLLFFTMMGIYSNYLYNRLKMQGLHTIGWL